MSGDEERRWCVMDGGCVGLGELSCRVESSQSRVKRNCVDSSIKDEGIEMRIFRLECMKKAMGRMYEARIFEFGHANCLVQGGGSWSTSVSRFNPLEESKQAKLLDAQIE